MIGTAKLYYKGKIESYHLFTPLCGERGLTSLKRQATTIAQKDLPAELTKHGSWQDVEFNHFTCRLIGGGKGILTLVFYEGWTADVCRYSDFTCDYEDYLWTYNLPKGRYEFI